MQSSCSYCSQLEKADKHHNFCSQAGDDIRRVKNNAFYFKSRHLYSGEHISRLTFRSINEGYQYHAIGHKEVMLDAGKYLITNEGEAYTSEIDTRQPIEGLVIAFSHEQAHSMGYYLEASDEQLLDNPFRKTSIPPFYQHTFSQTQEIQSILTDFKSAILESEMPISNYDEKFHQLMVLMLQKRKALQAKVHLMKVKKQSTKIEIFKRLSTGKEYIDLHLDKKINLSELSRICTLSPFHLLRMFKEFYGQTPHQYLNTKRLEKAQFLLKDTTLPIEQIAERVGFEHVRSFNRVFKQSLNTSPSVFRLSFF